MGLKIVLSILFKMLTKEKDTTFRRAYVKNVDFVIIYFDAM